MARFRLQIDVDVKSDKVKVLSYVKELLKKLEAPYVKSCYGPQKKYDVNDVQVIDITEGEPSNLDLGNVSL